MKKDFEDFVQMGTTCNESYEQANPVRMHDIFNLNMISKDEQLKYFYYNDPYFVIAMESNCPIKEIMTLMMERHMNLLNAYYKKEVNNFDQDREDFIKSCYK